MCVFHSRAQSRRCVPGRALFIVARPGCRGVEGEAVLTTSESLHERALPRGCTFSESDWRVLAPFWFPFAFSHEITGIPYAATLLVHRVVVYRLSDGSLSAARCFCHHRDAPLHLVAIKRNAIKCKYLGSR